MPQDLGGPAKPTTLVLVPKHGICLPFHQNNYSAAYMFSAKLFFVKLKGEAHMYLVGCLSSGLCLDYTGT